MHAFQLKLLRYGLSQAKKEEEKASEKLAMAKEVVRSDIHENGAPQSYTI